MYRSAMKSILSELVRQDRLIVVEQFAVEAPKTKQLVQKIQDLNLTDVLIITDIFDENLFLASRNLYHVGVCSVEDIDPISLITFEKVLITTSAVKRIEEMLA